MRRRAVVAVVAVLAVGCGDGDGSPAGVPVSAIDVPSPATTVDVSPTTTGGELTPDGTGPSTDPHTSSIAPGTEPPIDATALAQSIAWMVPTHTPGLRLIDATRQAVGDCGSPIIDCTLSRPIATLDYDTDDPSIVRGLRIVQGTPSANGTTVPGFVEDGEARTLGGRSVTAEVEDAFGPVVIAADWTEPDGTTTVSVSSSGLSWDELDAIVGSLSAVAPDSWPGAPVQPRLQRCVDARSQYAPTLIPDGWERFVLDIASTGSCDVPTILAMSLVLPGTADAPGVLETITVQFVGTTLVQPGERVTIGGHEVNMQTALGPDGPAGASVSFALEGVVVNAHGNAPPEVLDEIIASITPLDDAAWSQLVAEKATP